MKPSEFKREARKLVPMREPFKVKGQPGVGKTECIKQVCEEVGADLIITHPVVDDPTDYKGMPTVIRGERTTAEFLPFGNLRRLMEAKGLLVCFLDDSHLATPAVQGAMMQLVLEREINGKKISKDVTFISALNRREDKAGSNVMISPLLDRFITVVQLDFDVDDWAAWAYEHEMPPELVSFVRWKPQLLSKFDASAARDLQKVPTPRSVAGLGRLLNAGITNLEILQGSVGEGFAQEFEGFRRTWKELPDPQVIFARPMSATVPKKADVLFATMGSLAYRVETKTFPNLIKYLGRCPVEFQVTCIKDATKRERKLQNLKAFVEWADEHSDVFGLDDDA